MYEQWVCIRPCFGPEGKQTSHWACIEQLPEKNIKKKGENWYVPTGLGVNKEHMRNLAEMIYAILYPNQWAANLQNDPNLTVFHDFEHKNLMYHTAAYWQQVCKNWDKLSIFAALFNYNSNEDAKNALRKAIAEGVPIRVRPLLIVQRSESIVQRLKAEDRHNSNARQSGIQGWVVLGASTLTR